MLKILDYLDHRSQKLKESYYEKRSTINKGLSDNIYHHIQWFNLGLLEKCYNQITDEIKELRKSKEKDRVLFFYVIAKINVYEKKRSCSNEELLGHLSNLNLSDHLSDYQQALKYCKELGKEAFICGDLNDLLYTILACVKPFVFFMERNGYNEEDLEIVESLFRSKRKGSSIDKYYDIEEYDFNKHYVLLKDYKNNNKKLNVDQINIKGGFIAFDEFDEIVGYILCGPFILVDDVKTKIIYDLFSNIETPKERYLLKARLLGKVIRRTKEQYIYKYLEDYPYTKENFDIFESFGFENRGDNIFVKKERKKTGVKIDDITEENNNEKEKEDEKEDNDEMEEHKNDKHIKTLKSELQLLDEKKKIMEEDINNLPEEIKKETNIEEDFRNLKEEIECTKEKMISRKSEITLPKIIDFLSDKYNKKKYKKELELYSNDNLKDKKLYFNLNNMKIDIREAFIQALKQNKGIEIVYKKPYSELALTKENLKKVIKLLEWMGISHISKPEDVKLIDIFFDWKNGFEASWNIDVQDFEDNEEISIKKYEFNNVESKSKTKLRIPDMFTETEGENNQRSKKINSEKLSSYVSNNDLISFMQDFIDSFYDEKESSVFLESFNLCFEKYKALYLNKVKESEYSTLTIDDGFGGENTYDLKNLDEEKDQDKVKILNSIFLLGAIKTQAADFYQYFLFFMDDIFNSKNDSFDNDISESTIFKDFFEKDKSLEKGKNKLRIEYKKIVDNKDFGMYKYYKMMLNYNKISDIVSDFNGTLMKIQNMGIGAVIFKNLSFLEDDEKIKILVDNIEHLKEEKFKFKNNNSDKDTYDDAIKKINEKKEKEKKQENTKTDEIKESNTDKIKSKNLAIKLIQSSINEKEAICFNGNANIVYENVCENIMENLNKDEMTF